MRFEPVETESFTESQEIVQERIDEVKQELGKDDLISDVRLEIAIHTLTQFTRSELAEVADVEYNKSAKRIEIWEELEVLECVGVVDHDNEGRDPEVFVLKKLL